MPRWVIIVCLLLPGCARRAPDIAARDRAFQDSLSGATLTGSFTLQGKPELKQDRYQIESLSHVAGNTWLFRARMSESGVAIPMPLTVEWAGDTPVVTLTDLSIPTVGTFTARVLFYRGQYAGTWSGGGRGGTLFGTYGKGR